MIGLQLEDVGMTFAPPVHALRDINLTVAPAECLALVGPSGCGKTTLLRIIAGLEHPTSGLVKIDGRCVNEVPCHQRGVAMLLQRPAFILHQTVRHNLGWAWTLRKPWRLFLSTNQQREQELLRVAQILELEKDLDRPIEQLSGGQQQRVALGRCLLRQAKLWLLDEPLGHLDAPLRTELRRQMRALAEEFRVTTIHVTHDPEEAFSIGDRVAIMQQGILVQVDKPAQLRTRPANRFVAELIHHQGGGLNLLEGHISRDGIDTFFECPFGRWPVSLQILQGLRDSQFPSENFHSTNGKVHIMLGIAADDVRCGCNLSAGDDEVVFALPVQQQERTALGNWVIASGEPGRWVGRASEADYFERGQVVTTAFSLARAYWFDSTTGRTLVAPT